LRTKALGEEDVLPLVAHGELLQLGLVAARLLLHQPMLLQVALRRRAAQRLGLG
jgi:hypothetical protein